MSEKDFILSAGTQVVSRTEMTYPAILALAYSEAAMFLRGPEGSGVRAIISIHGQQEFGVEADVPHRLDLHFDDAESPDPADLVATYQARMRRQFAAENGRPQTPPSAEDAQRIISFAESIRNLDGIVLSHCGGGVSRSPAAALLCLATWIGAGAEQACMAHLMKIRPCASPHLDLVRFGDAILQREGQLMEAVRTWNAPTPDQSLPQRD